MKLVVRELWENRRVEERIRKVEGPKNKDLKRMVVKDERDKRIRN